MKAIVYTQAGPPSVLQLVDRPVPQPGPGEVRVRVVMSGVNPTDWKARAGAAPDQPLDGTEVTPNQDGAGLIDAIGEGVTGLAVGDRVWIYLAAFRRTSGTAQEYTVVPAKRVAKLPDGIGFDIGASLGVPALTAYRARTVHEGGPTRLSPGALRAHAVLVAGGAGEVGHAAIQLARWAGATVIATISSDEKATLARAAGAHHAVNYRDHDAAEQIRRIVPDGVDHIVDVSIAQNAALDVAVLAPLGVVAMYANDGGDVATLPIFPNMQVNARYQFILGYFIPETLVAGALEDITAALRDGALPIGEHGGLPITRFPLARTADAHAAVEAGTVGRVLIDVQPE